MNVLISGELGNGKGKVAIVDDNGIGIDVAEYEDAFPYAFGMIT